MTTNATATPSMTTDRIELCFVFPRCHAERLSHAERLLRWFCRIHGAALLGLDVAYDGPRRILFAFARLEGGRFGGADRRRVQFWAARAGGRALVADDLEETDWHELQVAVGRCDVRAIGLDAARAPASIASIATAAGLPPERRSYADDRPTLTLEIGGPGWDAVRWNDAEEALFVASPLAPPLGDPLPVVFRSRNLGRAAVEWARVVGVREPGEATPGQPAGFLLGLATAPAELKREVARNAPTSEYGTRASPRYAFSRPLDAWFRRADAEASSRYVASGWVENLSLGGAFVRTAAPLEEGARVELSLVLPSGSRLTTKATVAFTDVRGMGLRFELAHAAMVALHEALAQLAARPRRAMVVDDDPLARRMVADALVERGFEVLTASDAEEGLRVLADEILTLDLLVTDQFLPGTLGEEFVSRIRGEGGERELLIAVITGSPDGELAGRLRRAGADLLLGKELGPEIIALKVDTLLRARVAGLPERGLRDRPGSIAADSASDRGGAEVRA